MSDFIVILILAALAAWALYSCLKGGSGEGGSCGCGHCHGNCREKRQRK